MRKKVDAKRELHIRWRIDFHWDFEHVNLNVQANKINKEIRYRFECAFMNIISIYVYQMETIILPTI
jgi:hypothetical protein